MVSAIGSNSSAGAIVGKRRRISVIQARTWAEDLALLSAARGEHDGIDWGRLVGPAVADAREQVADARDQYDGINQYDGIGQYDGIDWDCLRDQVERVP